MTKQAVKMTEADWCFKFMWGLGFRDEQMIRRAYRTVDHVLKFYKIGLAMQREELECAVKAAVRKAKAQSQEKR